MTCQNNQQPCSSEPQAYSIFERPEKFEQSPIDIRDLVPIEYKTLLAFYKFDMYPNNLKLKNNGDTVSLSGVWPGNALNRPSITRGPLENGKFIFDKLHFHWPSEHKHNGNGFAIEMHVVFFNSKYESFIKALGKKNGVTVLGILYDQKSNIKNDYGIQKITEYLSELTEPGMSIEIPPFYLTDILNENMGLTNGYCFYRGSLTTKPYTENVNWIVSLKIGLLTDEQEYAFRRIQFSDPKRKENAREVQPIEKREIYQVMEKRPYH